MSIGLPARCRLDAIDDGVDTRAVYEHIDGVQCVHCLATTRSLPSVLSLSRTRLRFLPSQHIRAPSPSFGAGYGFERLGDATWFSPAACTYWGDIDTHGFAILDGLRARLPLVGSMLMSCEVLDAFRPFWTREETPHVADLLQLTESERSVYDDLRYDRLGVGVRLEQERIPMSYAMPAAA
jgi:hypothetical protein